jgi:hypothetical protein
MPRLGMAKVCCTEQSAHESKVVICCGLDRVLPSKIWRPSALLTTPATLPHTGFRSGVQPS